MEEEKNELKNKFTNLDTGFSKLKQNLEEKADGGLKSEVKNLRTDLSKLNKNVTTSISGLQNDVSSMESVSIWVSVT